jgi:membrane-bound lytic murein transglycosylase D
MLVAACSHIPSADPGLVADQAQAPAAQQPAAEKSAPAVTKLLAASAQAGPSAAKPAATPPTGAAPPFGEPIQMKDLDLPKALDLTRPADDLWDRIRNGFSMPNLDGPLVLERERWYAGEPDYLKRMVGRSKLYLYYIVEEVQKRGMPTEIALLPMVESAYNPMAYSRSHASGLWQFIPSTGKNYKLNQNWWIDARRDIIASTNAALDYLQTLYDMHGDWQLALASYNWGERAVARAVEKNKARGLPADYTSLPMPRETRGYLPKLQALKNIILNPQAFGVTLDAIPDEPYFVTIPSPQDIDLRLAAQLAEMSVDDLIALNPALNRPVISGPHTQILVLPADRGETFQRNLDAWDKPLTTWQPYTMKKGDRLDTLAARHGIVLSKLKLANGITSRTKVGPGSQLLLPVKGSGAAAEPLPAVFHQPSFPAGRGRLVYVVRKGDTVYGISRRYHVSTNNLIRWNHIGMLTTGQKLVIYGHGGHAKKTRKPARGVVKVSTAKPAQSVVATILPDAKK